MTGSSAAESASSSATEVWRQRTRIQNDPVRQFARLLDPVDELPFMIGLPEIDLEVECSGPRSAALLDVAERVAAVDRRLAHPEQV